MSYTIERVIEKFTEVCRGASVPVICPIAENGRLTKTLGRVKYTSDIYDGIVPTKVEFSKKFLETATDECIVSVIKHEAAHYIATMRTGERHGHDKYFKSICKELGTSADQVTTDVELAVPETKAYKYLIYCPSCKEIVGHRMKKCKVITDIEYYSCKTCDSKLEVIQNW